MEIEGQLSLCVPPWPAFRHVQREKDQTGRGRAGRGPAGSGSDGKWTSGKRTRREEDQTRSGPDGKRSRQEVDQTGRGPNGKRTRQEVNQTGRGPNGKRTRQEEDQTEEDQTGRRPTGIGPNGKKTLSTALLQDVLVFLVFDPLTSQFALLSIILHITARIHFCLDLREMFLNGIHMREIVRGASIISILGLPCLVCTFAVK